MSPPAVYIAKASQDHLRNGVELSAATGSNFRFLFLQPRLSTMGGDANKLDSKPFFGGRGKFRK